MALATVIVIAVALVAAAALAGTLAGIGPFAGTGAPPGGEPQTQEATPTGSVPDLDATADASFSESQAALAAKLPAGINSNCVPSSVADGSAGGAVSLWCQLPLSASADEVWVDEFRTLQTLDGAIADEVSRMQAPPGDCETDAIAHGTWEVPNVHAGSLLCYQRNGAAWLVWTYDDERILMKARRGGGDSRALYDWWRETAIFLR